MAKYTKWLQPDKLRQITDWALAGMTNERVAAMMGISRQTLSEWCNRFEEIRVALDRGKEVADYKIENSLFDRAMGCHVTEAEVVEHPNGSTTKRTRQRYIPGDVTAMIFWLKNRKPEDWRDKKDVDLSRGNDQVMQFIMSMREETDDLDTSRTPKIFT